MDYEEKEKNVYGLFYSDDENLRSSLKNIKKNVFEDGKFSLVKTSENGEPLFKINCLNLGINKHLKFHTFTFKILKISKFYWKENFFYSNSVKNLPKKLHEKKIVNIFVGNTKTK